MCLILFAYECHPQYSLILAANRDEYYNRPAVSAHFWEDDSNVLAGRDLEKLGTWMGITRLGRFSSITNYRDSSLLLNNPISRGELVSNYLLGDQSSKGYLEKVKETNNLYNGFNLLVGNASSLLFYSKIENKIKNVSPGIHGLSNHWLDTPWPKVVRGKKGLAKCIKDQKTVDPECLFEILTDTKQAKIDELPNTGVNLEWECILSSIFINSSEYGTRSSTVLLIDRSNHVSFIERSYFKGPKEWKEVAYNFVIVDG